MQPKSLWLWVTADAAPLSRERRVYSLLRGFIDMDESRVMTQLKTTQGNNESLMLSHMATQQEDNAISARVIRVAAMPDGPERTRLQNALRDERHHNRTQQMLERVFTAFEYFVNDLILAKQTRGTFYAGSLETLHQEYNDQFEYGQLVNDGAREIIELLDDDDDDDDIAGRLRQVQANRALRQANRAGSSDNLASEDEDEADREQEDEDDKSFAGESASQLSGTRRQVSGDNNPRPQRRQQRIVIDDDEESNPAVPESQDGVLPGQSGYTQESDNSGATPTVGAPHAASAVSATEQESAVHAQQERATVTGQHNAAGASTGRPPRPPGQTECNDQLQRIRNMQMEARRVVEQNQRRSSQVLESLRTSRNAELRARRVPPPVVRNTGPEEVPNEVRGGHTMDTTSPLTLEDNQVQREVPRFHRNPRGSLFDRASVRNTANESARRSGSTMAGLTTAAHGAASASASNTGPGPATLGTGAASAAAVAPAPAPGIAQAASHVTASASAARVAPGTDAHGTGAVSGTSVPTAEEEETWITLYTQARFEELEQARERLVLSRNAVVALIINALNQVNGTSGDNPSNVGGGERGDIVAGMRTVSISNYAQVVPTRISGRTPMPEHFSADLRQRLTANWPAEFDDDTHPQVLTNISVEAGEEMASVTISRNFIGQEQVSFESKDDAWVWSWGAFKGVGQTKLEAQQQIFAMTRFFQKLENGSYPCPLGCGYVSPTVCVLLAHIDSRCHNTTRMDNHNIYCGLSPPAFYIPPKVRWILNNTRLNGKRWDLLSHKSIALTLQEENKWKHPRLRYYRDKENDFMSGRVTSYVKDFWSVYKKINRKREDTP
jgi:hypothetical protein